MGQSRDTTSSDLLRLIDSARYSASLLGSPQDRASALSEVGFAAAVQGQEDRAVAIAREAENAALATTLHAAHVDAARALIAGSAALGDYDRCMALLPELNTVDAQDALLANLAYHAVVHSQVEKGIDFTEKISDGDGRSTVAANLAVYVGDDESYPSVDRFVGMLDGAPRDRVLRLVGLMSVDKMNAMDRAEKFLAKISDPSTRTRCLARLSLVHTDHTETERLGALALTMAEAAGSSKAVDAARALQVRLATKLGDLDGASNLALGLAEGLRDAALAAVCTTALGRAEGHTYVSSLAPHISSPRERVVVLLRAASSTYPGAAPDWRNEYISAARTALEDVKGRDAAVLAAQIRELEDAIARNEVAELATSLPGEYGGRRGVSDAATWGQIYIVLDHPNRGGSYTEEVQQIRNTVDGSASEISSRLGRLRGRPDDGLITEERRRTALREVQRLMRADKSIISLELLSERADLASIVDRIRNAPLLSNATLVVLAQLFYEKCRWEHALRVAGVVQDSLLMYQLALRWLSTDTRLASPGYVRGRVVELAIAAIQAQRGAVTTRERATLGIALLQRYQRDDCVSGDRLSATEREQVLQLLGEADWLSLLAAAVFFEPGAVATVCDIVAGVKVARLDPPEIS